MIRRVRVIIGLSFSLNRVFSSISTAAGPDLRRESGLFRKPVSPFDHCLCNAKTSSDIKSRLHLQAVSRASSRTHRVCYIVTYYFITWSVEIPPTTGKLLRRRPSRDALLERYVLSKLHGRRTIREAPAGETRARDIEDTLCVYDSTTVRRTSPYNDICKNAPYRPSRHACYRSRRLLFCSYSFSIKSCL